jgi:O-acetyl-ADP-ribose deacetylase (regulator of RNase III)
MIEFKTGDIFSIDTQAIVNTVNCVGVMGRGIALQFKKKYPDNFRAYEAKCKRKEIIPGKMHVHEMTRLINPRLIINFPTKRHWRGNSRLDDIKTGLSDLIQVIHNKDIKSIALPPLGTGLGGLDWAIVKQLMQNAFQPLDDVRVVIFEPRGAPSARKMTKNKKIPAMTPGRAALIGLIYRYLEGMLDPFITLLEIHKLMYFMQEAGENLRLDYCRHYYGPYANNLRHVMNAIEGHFLTGYADGGDDPQKIISPVPSVYKDAIAFLAANQKTQNNFNKVADLVDGFESPSGLELLSSVHWVITKENVISDTQLISQIHNWNERKKQFNKRQILLARQVLTQKGWIHQTLNFELFVN